MIFLLSGVRDETGTLGTIIRLWEIDGDFWLVNRLGGTRPFLVVVRSGGLVVSM